MISINNSDWLIPISHFYFYIIYTWTHGSGMQIEDLAPFRDKCLPINVIMQKNCSE